MISDGYGGVIYLSVEDYLNMTDEDWQQIIALNRSEMVEDPFHNSYSSSKLNIPLEEHNEEILKSIKEEIIEEYEDFLEDEDLEQYSKLDDYDLDLDEQNNFDY
jgi:hypothetical protein